MSETREAERPVTSSGKQYHLHVAAGDLASIVLLPGDPGRVPVLASAWDTSEDVAHHREYRSMRGSYRGVPISACSTGIGGPSTEIALNELAAVGCDTFLRLGTTGGLQEDLRVGDVVISTASVRWDGSSDSYAPPAFPAVASYEVVLALVEACERLSMTYHLGISAATSSFYAGQSRPAFGDYIGVADDRVQRLQAMGVLNFEMESATVFTLSSLFKLRGGAACLVVADRFRNEFRPEGADEVLARLGAEASVALAEMDEVKRRAGRHWYFPSLHRAGG
jgi:uridine phosphorylase